MKQIYFIRHSIRDTSIQDDLTAPLTLKGQQLAEELKRIINLEYVDKIYSSPCVRAVQTVEPISESISKPIVIKENLREREINEWLIDFDEFAKKQWDDKNFKTNCGESLVEVRKRAVTCFEEIVTDSSQKVVISSHGTFLACLFHELTSGQFAYLDFLNMTQPDVYLGLFDEKNQLIELKRKTISSLT